MLLLFIVGESYLTEQFHQITHYLVEQFRQMIHYLTEQFRQITHYLMGQFCQRAYYLEEMCVCNMIDVCWSHPTRNVGV